MYKKINLELSKGIFEFHNHKLQTRFCFAFDEVMDCRCGTNTYQDSLNSARNVKFEWFLDENLKEVKKELEHLKEWKENPEIADVIPYLFDNYEKDACFLGFKRKWLVLQEKGGSAYTSEIIAEGLTQDDTDKLIAFYEQNIRNITKRCNTYWKKFGANKLDTWTYSSND